MWRVIGDYFGNSVYLVILSFFLLFLVKERKRNYVRKLLAAAFVFVVTFPVLYIVCGKFKMSSAFYRFIWAFPLSVIIGILMTKLMEKSNHKKMMGCLLVIISILLLNNRGLDISAWKMSDNLFMLDEEILQIGDMIEEDSEEENIVVLGEVDFMMQIRQYSSRICWGYDTRHYMIYAAPRINVNASYRIAAAIQKHYCPDDLDIMSDLDELNADYIVIYQDSPFVEYLPEGNYEIIGETSKYKVIKMNYNTRYQEKAFTQKPLSDAHIETESVEVIIPGLSEEYHFLCLMDLHIITENENIALENLETVRARLSEFSVAEGLTSADYYSGLPEILDSCNADLVLLGGDIIDFCSYSNVICVKDGLDRLETSYIYVRADHDSKPYWCEGLTDDECSLLHADIDGNDEVWCMDFPEFYVVGLSNSTGQISESALAQMKEIFAKGRPIILLTHVPYDSMLDASLQEASKEVWEERALVWGEDCFYQPDANTKEFMDMIYAEDSLVKEILCGHLHFAWDGYITENAHEHVFSPAFERKIGVVTVKGAE